MSYRDTLNLPNTEFPMRANLAKREPDVRKYWAEINLYQALRADKEGCETFLLHDGPPYANGDIHVGHALNKIIKDIIIKSKNLSGFDTPFVPGWDCHGLPVELQVEKKQGKKLSSEVFRQACREYAQSQVELQKSSFCELGVVADWEQPYRTMDFTYEANTIRALADMLEAGFVVPGYKPVHWCLDCQSALAEAEVEYQEKTSQAVDVSFMVVDPQSLYESLGLSTSLGLSIPIWTTTVWTLPANEAVALHPDLIYSMVKTKHATEEKLYLLAKDLVEIVLERWQINEYEILAEHLGQAFNNVMLQHPFNQRQVPVLMATHVTTEAGTGAVHTAPGHGEDDYHAGLSHQLPVRSAVSGNGCYVDDVLGFAGQHINKAMPAIIDKMQEFGTLIHKHSQKHSYPHCWRHKSPVIFRATPQWFVPMEQQGLRGKLLASIKAVEWQPQWGELRMTRMLESRPDWCISRQRQWGTPLALFVHKSTQALHPDMPKIMRHVAAKVQEHGIEAWHTMDSHALLGSDAEHYEKVMDILDVWFDSGVSHFGVLKKRDELHKPADLYLEGSDQYRGWFQTSLITSIVLDSHAPYRSVLTHGFVVDGQGRKMSKSLGNVVSPKTIIKQQGADILRLWVAGTDYRNDVAVSDEILLRVGEAYRRIRNSARYLLSNLYDFTPDHVLPLEQLLSFDRWVMDKAHQLQERIIEAYENYQLHLVYQHVHQFCSVELGSLYLDITKDRQYTCPADSIARRSSQTAMYHLLHALVRWIAPILSHTAEELWRYMPGNTQSSALLTRWYDGLASLQDGALSREGWVAVMAIREVIYKSLEAMRKEGHLRAGLEAHVFLYADDATLSLLAPLVDEFHFILITSKFSLAPLNEAPMNAQNTDLAGVKVLVEKLNDPKCERCWHLRTDVGEDELHPSLCARCIANLRFDGEKRVLA